MDFNINISTAKNEIKEILLKIEDLRQSHSLLNNSIRTISNEEFDELLIKIEFNQNILNNLLDKYENSEFQRKLKKKIDRRSRKRKKIITKHKEKLKRRKELHDHIDKSLLSIRGEFTEIPKYNSCKSIKNTLLDISEKITDLKKTIKDIKSAREPCNEFEVDANTSKKLLKSMDDKLIYYNAESIRLKEILDFNSESLEDQWRKVLFGDIRRDRSIVKRSELHTFFEIRRIWDSYAMPSSNDSFTSNWVLPPNKPSEQWVKYLFKN